MRLKAEGWKISNRCCDLPVSVDVQINMGQTWCEDTQPIDTAREKEPSLLQTSVCRSTMVQEFQSSLESVVAVSYALDFV